MKKFLLIIIACLFGIFSFSQINENSRLFQNEIDQTKGLFSNKNKVKTDFSFSTGASFTSFGKGFSSSNTFVAPSMNLSFSPKFHLDVTTVFSSNFNSSSFIGPGQENSSFAFPDKSFGIMAHGNYKISEDLQISGMINYTQNQITSQVNPGAFQFNEQSFMMGIDYKISESVRIGGQVGMTNNPFGRYQNNFPFSNRQFSGYSSPFMSNW